MSAPRLILKLADLAQNAIPKFERSGSGVMVLAVPCETPLDPHLLTHVLDEQLPLGSVSPQCDERVSLKRPVFHLSAGILDIEVEICVGALPVEFREGPGELPAILAVELRHERVMRRRRRRQQEQIADHRSRTKNSRNLHQNYPH